MDFRWIPHLVDLEIFLPVLDISDMQTPAIFLGTLQNEFVTAALIPERWKARIAKWKALPWAELRILGDQLPFSRHFCMSSVKRHMVKRHTVKTPTMKVHKIKDTRSTLAHLTHIHASVAEITEICKTAFTFLHTLKKNLAPLQIHSYSSLASFCQAR